MTTKSKHRTPGGHFLNVDKDSKDKEATLWRPDHRGGRTSDTGNVQALRRWKKGETGGKSAKW